MRTSDNCHDRKRTRLPRHPVLLSQGLPPAGAGAVGAAATAGGTCQQMGTRPPGPQSPGGEGPPLPDGPHNGRASPSAGSARSRMRMMRPARPSVSTLLGRISASPAAVLPRPTPCSRTGRGCQSGLLTGQASALRERTRSPHCVSSAGPARGEASEAQPAEGPGPGVLTARAAAASPESGLIQGWGRPSRGKQRVASEDWAGRSLHSSRRETGTRCVVSRAMTPEDTCPDPQGPCARVSPHAAEALCGCD